MEKNYDKQNDEGLSTRIGVFRDESYKIKNGKIQDHNLTSG